MATQTLAAKRHRERVHSARLRVRLARELGSVEPHANDPRGALPWDPARLRGLPAIGVRGGLGGAIPGTRPGVGLH